MSNDTYKSCSMQTRIQGGVALLSSLSLPLAHQGCCHNVAQAHSHQGAVLQLKLLQGWQVCAHHLHLLTSSNVLAAAPEGCLHQAEAANQLAAGLGATAAPAAVAFWQFVLVPAAGTAGTAVTTSLWCWQVRPNCSYTAPNGYVNCCCCRCCSKGVPASCTLVLLW